MSQRSLRLVIVAFLFVTATARAERLVQFCSWWLDIHYETFEPFEGPTKADIFYFTGFADRLENHQALFNSWRREGYRVISYSFPKHGLSKGFRPLSTFGYRSLANIAAEIERRTLQDPNRPLFFAGWSTGGALAVRWLQSGWFPKLSRRVSGAVLFAPGVSVYNVIGEWGFVTQRTLTRNPRPNWVGGVWPPTPLFSLPFAGAIKINSWLAQSSRLPSDVPVLVLLGEHEQDKYANINSIEDWAAHAVSNGAPLQVQFFPGAYHALDVEPGGVGEAVISAATRFIAPLLRL